MSSRGLGLLVSLFLVFMVVVASCASPAPSQKAEKIVIGYSAVTGSQGLPFVMKDAGIFEKYGLEPDLQLVQGGALATKALIAGNIQIAQVAGPAVVEAYANGADVAIIAGIVSVLEHKLLVKNNIDKPSDLKGKRIAVLQVGDITETAAKYYIKGFGLEPGKDVAIVAVGGPAERIAAVEAGAADATILIEPFVTRAKAKGLKEMASPSTIEYQATTFTTTKSFIKSKPDVVKRFVKAVVDGIHFYKTHKEASMKSLASFLKLQDDMPAVEATWKGYTETMADLPYPTVKGVQTIMDEMVSSNEKAKNMKPEDVVDMSFVKELDTSGFVKGLK